MRLFWGTAAAVAFAFVGCANQATTSASLPPRRAAVSKRLPEARPPDVGYLLNPGSLEAYRSVPGSEALQEIIRVGARALDWVDILQKDVAPHEREQIWRRVDRIGREASPEAPLIYNPDTILENFRKELAKAPAAVVEAIQARGNLSPVPPPGLSAKDVVAAVREVHTLYSRASRWLMLYEWRFSLGKPSHDFRGWLKLNRKREALLSQTTRWPELTEVDREQIIGELGEVCPLAYGDAVAHCRAALPSLKSPRNGAFARKWLQAIHARGKREYDSKFGVREAHAGAYTATAGVIHQLDVPVSGIDSDLFNWIQERVTEGWTFKNSDGKIVFSVKLFAAAETESDSLKIEWEKGALPHVNAIAGDVVTMDSNTPRWLEHTQTVMRHEFGHVLGFPDCYTEFWDEELNSFIYYSLDPNDAMCALSGQFSDRHRDALVRGYFPAPAL